MKKLRIDLPDKYEKDKALLVAIANLEGIEKQPQNPEIYIKSLIDNIDIIYQIKEENELEDIANHIELELEMIEKVEEIIMEKLSRLISRVRK